MYNNYVRNRIVEISKNHEYVHDLLHMRSREVIVYY